MEENIIRLPTLYDVLIDISKHHIKFKSHKKIKYGYADLLNFDFTNKSIYNGKYFIMKEGVVVRDEIILSNGNKYIIKDLPLIDESLIEEDCFSTVEQLYANYKRSVPNKSDLYLKSVFKALPDTELDFDDMLNNMPRNEAKYRLEAFILFGSLLGIFYWENDKHWYWQSKNDRDCIIYKEWII